MQPGYLQFRAVAYRKHGGHLTVGGGLTWCSGPLMENGDRGLDCVEWML